MDLKERIATLESRMDDLRKRWPAHSVKPSMILEMEELESQLDELRNMYRASMEKKEVNGNEGQS